MHHKFMHSLQGHVFLEFKSCKFNGGALTGSNFNNKGTVFEVHVQVRSSWSFQKFVYTLECHVHVRKFMYILEVAC